MTDREDSAREELIAEEILVVETAIDVLQRKEPCEHCIAYLESVLVRLRAWEKEMVAASAALAADPAPVRREPQLGCATTKQLIDELAARADVSSVIGERWPSYRTIDDNAICEHCRLPTVVDAASH